MKHTEYLEILIRDLNFIIDKESKQEPKGLEHIFRLKVLILHLHTDFLLTEIIEHIKNNNFTRGKNKEFWNMDGKEFAEKLRIVYATGHFDEDFLETLRKLNNIRNNLSHKLLPDIKSLEDKIRSIKIEELIKQNLSKELDPIEHLVMGCIGYINILAEYLWVNLKKEKIKSRIYIPSLSEDKISFTIQELKILEINVASDPYLEINSPKVTFIEFMDYECPFCQRFWIETYSRIKKKYIDTGKIKYVHKDFPLESIHPGALSLSIFAKGVQKLEGNESYFKFRDFLFDKQWNLDLKKLEIYDKIKGDYSLLNEIKKEINSNIDQGVNFGVKGTPTFIINDKIIHGAQPYETFEQVIEDELRSI